MYWNHSPPEFLHQGPYGIVDQMVQSRASHKPLARVRREHACDFCETADTVFAHRDRRIVEELQRLSQLAGHLRYLAVFIDEPLQLPWRRDGGQEDAFRGLGDRLTAHGQQPLIGQLLQREATDCPRNRNLSGSSWSIAPAVWRGIVDD